jgi:hypothetical protein
MLHYVQRLMAQEFGDGSERQALVDQLVAKVCRSRCAVMGTLHVAPKTSDQGHCDGLANAWKV